MKRTRYIRENVSKTPSEEFGSRRIGKSLSESDDPLRDELLTRMGVISDGEDEDENEDDEYMAQCISRHMDFEKFMRTLVRATREADVDPYDVQEELDSYGDYGDLVKAYKRGDLYNYNALERQFAEDLPDSVDKEAVLLDLWNNAYDLMEEAAGRSRRRMADESVRPAGNPRSRRKLDESIDYGSLSQGDQLKIDRLVQNLRAAKGTLESLRYRGYVEDDVTRGELIEMHMAVCKMLDKLPW